MADAQLAAEQRVRSYCRWHVTPVLTETLTLDGPGSATLMLPSLHVTDVTAVTVDYGDGATTLDVADYDWSEMGILVLRCGVFPRRFQSVTVSLVHGYAAWPDDVQDVIDRIQKRVALRTDNVVRVGQVQYAVPTEAGVGIGGTLSAFDQADLAPYRLPPRP